MQVPGLSVGIVADDLTGACDTALQFFSTHAETHVLVDLARGRVDETMSAQESQGSNVVWSVNTSTRNGTPYEAEARVRQAVALYRDRFGIEHFYKKVDSTLRGHIAHECLGMLEELHAQCAVIVPAYPSEGRRTVGGYQLVRGIPVERTVVARDPLFPVRQSHLPTLLEQATRPEIVGYVPLALVLHGAGPILLKLKELIQEGRKLIVVDATNDEDLTQIALAIEKVRKYAQVVPCGSAGLGRALAALWSGDLDERDDEQKPPPLSVTASPVLMVLGSVTDTTRQQVRKLMEYYNYYGLDSQLEVFEPTPGQLLGIESCDDLIVKMGAALGERNTVVVSSALMEDSYAKTLTMAREHGISDSQASRAVQETLAQITLELSRTKTFKLVLAGGETTCQVCDALNIRTLRLLAEVEPAVPLSVDSTGRWIVTKSGGFGSPMILANAVRFIKQRETASVHA